MDYQKKCPICKKEIIFKNENSYRKSINKKLKCRSCAALFSMTQEVKIKISNKNRGKKLSQECKDKISNSLKGIVFSEEHKLKIGAKHKNKIVTKETRKKISLARMGKPSGKHSIQFLENLKIRNKNNPPFLGKKHSEKTKNKMRLKRAQYIYENKQWFSIGKKEEELLNNLEKLDNCKIQRQFYIKNLGYCADGYCKETNTIYEIYEPKHRRKTEKDFKRQQEIQNFLKCNFIIIWTDTLKREDFYKRNLKQFPEWIKECIKN